MIRGYPRHASVMPGDTLTLHVATDSPRFRVAFYHWGDGPALVWRTGWMPGHHAEDGTPSSYQLLAAAPLGQRWQELPPRERHGAGEGVHAATLGIYRRNGSVFSAGTTDWAQVLGCGRDLRIERITRNVLDRLGRHAAACSSLC
jgi:hypothetical protein